VRTILRVGIAIALLALVAWWSLALRFRLPVPAGVATAVAIVYAVAALALLVWVRPFHRAALAVLASFVVLALWWSTIRPSNERDWAPEYANTSYGELDGDRLVLHNVRNFDYRTETDFTPRWETRTYDLSRITELGLFMSYWGSPWIAHTILSWRFAEGSPLAISIETRRERTESYSAVRGFFREYEIFYVAADERDLVRLRTNYRGEHVYLYRMRTDPGRARALLLDYLKSMNALHTEPAWYNALTDNCTTSIRTHVKDVGGASALDWRLLANGHADEMMYERQALDTALPFPQLKSACSIDDRAKAADQDPRFSERIRDGVPGPPRS
jgi:hypothetical protein